MVNYTHIPTALEMDGIFTEEDIRNRYKIMIQCFGCFAWTQHDAEHGITYKPCSNPKCGIIDYDWKSYRSFRTYNASTDIKRRPKRK